MFASENIMQSREVEDTKQTALGEITAANVIPALLVPKPNGDKLGKGEATAWKRKYESQKELLDKIDLTRLEIGVVSII